MKGKTILLVEDEAIIAMLETLMLEKHGYQVITAGSGAEAIQTVDSSPQVDLVLMDIDLGLGCMDGTQAAEQILQCHDLPLIFLSAHTEPEVVEKTEGITSYGYIVKNSGETVLNASIKMAFRLFEARQLERQKDAALRESEERFRLSIEATHDGLWDHNIATHTEFTSPAYWTMLGYAPGELPVDPLDWLSLVHPQDRPDVLGANQACSQGECDSFTIEFRMQTRSGGWCWVQSRGKVFQRDAQGRALRIVGTHTDITARKQAEEALYESESRYRSLVETADDVIVLTDLQGRHLFHNSAYYTSLGYTAEEVMDLDGFAPVHPDDLAMVRANMAGLIATGSSAGEYRVRHRDGHWIYRYNKARVIYNAQGQPEKILSIIRDVTERKLNEEKLRQSERRFRALVENSFDAITLIGPDGQTIYSSPAVARLSGFPLDETLNHAALANAHPDDRPALQAAYARLLAHPGRVEHLEFRSVRKDGTTWWTEATVTNLLEEPDVQAIIVNYRDITQRKEAEAALLQARDTKATTQKATTDERR